MTDLWKDWLVNFLAKHFGKSFIIVPTSKIKRTKKSERNRNFIGTKILLNAKQAICRRHIKVSLDSSMGDVSGSVASLNASAHDVMNFLYV